MNEIVKYHNDLSNQIVIKTLNANELNFFMAICSKMRDQETNEIVFKFQQLKDLVHWDNNNNEHFIKSLENTNRKLIALNFRFEDEREIVQFVLFPTFTINKDKKTLTVAVNKKFAFLLNNLSSNFTRFELENFTILQSKYSKYLYKELMKFKSTGYMIMSIEEFRDKLDIPVKYRMSEINIKVLKPINEEIPNILKGFKINKIKKGRNIEKIEFSFIPIKKETLKNKTEIIELVEEKVVKENKKDDIKDKKQAENFINNLALTEITEEEYNNLYQKHLEENNLKNNEIQKTIFKLMNKHKYKIIEKKVYTIDDIPEEKLLSKNGKKLVGGALQARINKILSEMNKKEGI